MEQRMKEAKPRGQPEGPYTYTVILKYTEQLENTKKTHFVDNTGCKISAANGAQITLKTKWRLKYKRLG
jgi:hypothetical protein